MTSNTIANSPPATRHQSFSGRVRNFANMTKPSIDIQIGSQRRPSTQTWINSFTTGDRINGTVHITAPNDTKFDDLEISFVGQTRTFVDKIGSASAVNGRTEAFSQFIQLRQPIRPSQLPANRLLEANKTYSLPFTFVVPAHLLHGSSCRHPVANDQVRDAHLQLPPSMGDADLSGFGSTLLDDLAPDMARVQYAIKCALSKNRERDGKELPLVSKQKKIRVIPAFPEQPPLNVDDKTGEYCLHAEKGIRKGMFKGKLGRLVVEAAQPSSIHLPAPNDVAAAPATTMATVMVRFDPADANAAPPRLGQLTSRLKVATFFASAPRTMVPCKALLMYDVAQAVAVDTLSLSQRCMSSAQWQRFDPDTPGYNDLSMRRDSTMSMTSPNTKIPAPTSAWSAGKPFYTAKLLVPISLPKGKAFLPTFHSCLVSRVYILDMSLSIPAPGSGVSSSLQLKVPLQLSSAGADDTRNMSDEEAAAAEDAEAAADDFFVPRSVAPPSPEYQARNPSSTPLWATGRFSPMSSAPVSRRVSVNPETQNEPSSAPPDYSLTAPQGSVPLPAFG